MKLYDFAVAPSPRRVRMFLAEKGITIPTVQVDLRAFTLPVIEASAQECDAHAAVLKELDKSSNGKTIWPKTAESVP